MRTLVAVALLALLTGWAVGATDAPPGASAGAAQPTAAHAADSPPGHGAATAFEPSACLGSWGTKPTDSRDLLVTPASQFTLDMVGPATDVRLIIALCSGVNLGAQVTVPDGCTSETMALNVIGLSNGQAVADIRCAALAAGEHMVLLETGGSAFSGRADLYGARFG